MPDEVAPTEAIAASIAILEQTLQAAVDRIASDLQPALATIVQFAENSRLALKLRCTELNQQFTAGEIAKSDVDSGKLALVELLDRDGQKQIEELTQLAQALVTIMASQVQGALRAFVSTGEQ